MTDNSQVLLSVVIPTFRRPEMLRAAIQSVLDNGFAGPMEIIVSDDDPDESARPVVEGWELNLPSGAAAPGLAEVNPHLRYAVHRAAGAGPAENVQDPEWKGHPAPNWDFAARLARGTYLFKLDDDDVILPGFLTRCVDFLEAHPGAACVYTAHAIVDMQTGTRQELVDRVFFGDIRTAGSAPGSALTVDGARYTLGVLVNEGGYPVNHKTIGVCRRSCAERIDFYRLAAEDFAMSAALGLTGDIGYIPEVLYEYRMHGANAMTTDLSRVWRFSRHALDGMEKLEAGLQHPQLGPRWLDILDRCRQALPLFYLYRALRDQSRAAAWRLWGKLRSAKAMESEWKGWCLLLGGTLTPAFVRTGMFEAYRSSAALRRSFGRILGIKP